MTATTGGVGVDDDDGFNDENGDNGDIDKYELNHLFLF